MIFKLFTTYRRSNNIKAFERTLILQATPACTGACGSQDLDTLNANIASTAPASICVNAGMWNDYVGGVMTTEACGGYAYDDLDHCVQLTGFNQVTLPFK